MAFSYGTAPQDKLGAVGGSAPSEYEKRMNELITAYNNGSISKEAFDKRAAELQEVSFGPKSFDIGEFESLLSRLEGSKMRQQRQKSVEGRRDIMSQGLASMMSNF